VKRRPKPHQLLNVPRNQMIEISHRSRYKKPVEELHPKQPLSQRHSRQPSQIQQIRTPNVNPQGPTPYLGDEGATDFHVLKGDRCGKPDAGLLTNGGKPMIATGAGSDNEFMKKKYPEDCGTLCTKVKK
jgi:hypothetical protein